MDKHRRRAHHLQLVHSEPASTAPLSPLPHQWSASSRIVAALGVGVLGLLIWTRASDMPAPRDGDAQAAPAMPDVTQSFPTAAASLRHISSVLAFDALPTASPGQPLEPGDSVPGRSAVTFQLYNRSAQSAYFLLFGVDRQQHFSWLYPPNTPGDSVNRSLPLALVPLIELPEPVTLPEDVAHFTLVGVFTDAPVTTEEVKQAWQRGGAMAVQAGLHAQVQILPLNASKP